MEDPDPWLNALNIAFACAVDPGQPAIIDAQHRISVNWETYYVSGDTALDRFRAAPHQYTGPVTDPVERVRFQPGADSPWREHDGRHFYFANQENASRFDEDPAAHATPMLGMVEMP